MDKDPQKFMSVLMEKYNDKPSSIGEIRVYLWSGTRKVEYGNGYYSCTMSLDYYVKEDTRNVMIIMKYENMEFNKKHYDINY